jgi:RNA polymerase primary sigma factor
MKKFVLQNKFTNYDSDSFKRYLTDIQDIKVLTVDEESILTAKLSSGDKTAADELVRRNLRFVISVAKQYVTANNRLEDLVNEGNYALMEAVKRYDPTTGFRFFSYAVWWIRRNILIYSNTNKMIRLPHNKNFIINKMTEQSKLIEQKLNRLPTYNDFIDLGFEKSDILDFLNIDLITPTSMDATSHENSGDGEFIISDSIVNSTFGEPDNSLQYDGLKYKVNVLLNKIKKPKEREVIKMYFGLCGYESKTLQNIAAELDMTSERIRQIRDKILLDLKQYSEILH